MCIFISYQYLFPYFFRRRRVCGGLLGCFIIISIINHNFRAKYLFNLRCILNPGLCVLWVVSVSYSVHHKHPVWLQVLGTHNWCMPWIPSQKMKISKKKNEQSGLTEIFFARTCERWKLKIQSISLDGLKIEILIPTFLIIKERMFI